MTLQIEVWKDYVMIGTQRVNRPASTPAGYWLEEWESIKRYHEAPNDRR